MAKIQHISGNELRGRGRVGISLAYVRAHAANDNRRPKSRLILTLGAATAAALAAVVVIALF